MLEVLHTQQKLHHKPFPIDHASHHHMADESSEGENHAIYFDAVTYLNDYLHIDLKSSHYVILTPPDRNSYSPDFNLATNFLMPEHFVFLDARGRDPPPLYEITQLYSDLPVYLATQRLRI
jgi:hypothetical protein